jgi:hypothetical protein
MAIKIHNPMTGKDAEAKDQAQFDRLYKPAGWQKADPSDDDNAGLAQRVAALEARIEELEALLTAPEPPADDDEAQNVDTEPPPDEAGDSGTEPQFDEAGNLILRLGDEQEAEAETPKRKRGGKPAETE